MQVLKSQILVTESEIILIKEKEVPEETGFCLEFKMYGEMETKHQRVKKPLRLTTRKEP